MSLVTVVCLGDPYAALNDPARLSASPGIAEVIPVVHSRDHVSGPQAPFKQVIEAEPFSSSALARVIESAVGRYLLLVGPAERVEPGHRAIERFLAVAEDSGAGLVYANFRDLVGESHVEHPVTDYQLGSIGDAFDFGPLMLVPTAAAKTSLLRRGALDPSLRWGGLYELRLKLSQDAAVLRIPEPLYTRRRDEVRATGETHFAYLDPANRDRQAEMEKVATGHLKRLNAWLAPDFKPVLEPREEYPITASIVIPVRNRERTIRDTVRSALSQKTDFGFNVIVVDNHSTDRTSEVLAGLAAEDGRVVHLVPRRADLLIGGCWNEAIYSRYCGRYAVQLDSDDLYINDLVLQSVVETLRRGPYAMVVGSYVIVDFNLNEIPPGLIDHREWTRENGRNNALRVNGLGAPRAFDVSLLRRYGFPNVSYGEDYAVALRISREYEIARIYEPLYFARRWEGNSDAALPLEVANRYDQYKDYLRTTEILARQRMNADELAE